MPIFKYLLIIFRHTCLFFSVPQTFGLLASLLPFPPLHPLDSLLFCVCTILNVSTLLPPSFKVPQHIAQRALEHLSLPSGTLFKFFAFPARHSLFQINIKHTFQLATYHFIQVKYISKPLSFKNAAPIFSFYLCSYDLRGSFSVCDHRQSQISFS